ncbi:MAG: hypothetical protein M3314_03815, partial [Actinomycetota bacterium]|nr:hypothetical protein [Actinomycetota bacterium]
SVMLLTVVSSPSVGRPGGSVVVVVRRAVVVGWTVVLVVLAARRLEDEREATEFASFSSSASLNGCR